MKSNSDIIRKWTWIGLVCRLSDILAKIVVDFFGWRGEKPKEYSQYFEVFQRSQTEKDAARLAEI